MIPIPPMVAKRKGWLHSGLFTRKGETVDYVARMDLFLCWVRYKGDSRLVGTWQSLILHKRWTMKDGIVWSGSCPFCCSQVYEIVFYERSLRCRNCLRLQSRWNKQTDLTRPLRNAIRRGELSEVSAKLQKGFPEAFQSVLAMEMTGLAPKRFSSPKETLAWKQVKNRSISK